MRGLFFGRGGGFYFVRLENKNPHLGEPRWTTSGWPASRLKDTFDIPYIHPIHHSPAVNTVGAYYPHSQLN